MPDIVELFRDIEVVHTYIDFRDGERTHNILLDCAGCSIEDMNLRRRTQQNGRKVFVDVSASVEIRTERGNTIGIHYSCTLDFPAEFDPDSWACTADEGLIHIYVRSFPANVIAENAKNIQGPGEKTNEKSVETVSI